MIVVTEHAGAFGPFANIQLSDDRAVCDGSEIPFSVVGTCTVHDVEVPEGGRAEDYDWDGEQLVPKAST